jgi:hypoxanthine phosphoribosyltransferase
MVFIRPKSYNGRDNGNGVQFTKDIELELKGKRVYIVEDIIDSGATMIEILQRVSDKMAADVRVVTLVQRAGTHMPADHTCFEIDEEWVCGYGFDDNGLKRNYRNIYKL